ncbi:MAG TPA: hypothetical protein VHT92_13000, partial [Candidatus Cybelea sp.]|nr:hypothetical protein [Candidatus Cybelea sp.]
KRLVVVRYIPATPPPSPAPPPPAAPPPPPPPTPAPVHSPNVFFVAGDYLISPKIYNQFAPGNQANGSWTARGGVEFNGGLPFMIEVDYKNWQYPHNCGVAASTATINNAPQCYVTVIGSRGTAYVPAFTAVNRDGDVRIGYRVIDPHVYVAIGYLWASNNYGYPNMNAVGVGIEKLPDYGKAFQYYGSVFYYPNVNGTYTTSSGESPANTSYGLGYNVLKYQVGIGWAFMPSVYLDAGWAGENGANKNNAPISYTFNGPYVGLGFMLPF